MSSPLNHSINSEIPEEYKRVTYLSFVQLCNLIYNIGINGYIWTIDAEDAYYRIPVNKKYYHLLGIKWRNKYIFFKCLPFGLSTAPSIYNQFADGLKWACEHHYPNTFYSKITNSFNIDHYLDDFVGGNSNFDISKKQMSILENIFKYLNIPTSKRKCIGPFQTIDVLGYTFSTLILITIAIQEKKRIKYLKFIKNILSNNFITINLYEKVTGYTRHCTNIIPNAKSFCRGFDHHKHFLIKAAKDDITITGNKKFNISKESRFDLLIWKSLLSNLEYYTLPIKFIIKPNNLPTIHVYTDATTTIGFGGFTTNGRYFQSKWDKLNLPYTFYLKQKDIINVLELYAIVLAAELYGKYWKHHLIIFHSDNKTAVRAASKCSVNLNSDNYYAMANITKHLALLSIKYNFQYNSIHIEGKKNTIADALSRFFPNPLNYTQINLPKIKFSISPTRCSLKMNTLIIKTFKNEFFI